MTPSNRPLSPHLQVYRPQLTSVLSITHRATGMFLAAGVPVLVYWLWAVADGAESFATSQAYFGSNLGRTLLFMWCYALFYHLLNGIRHLAWDAGLGFDIPVLYKSGWVVVAASVGLTLITWLLGYAARGAAGS